MPLCWNFGANPIGTCSRAGRLVQALPLYFSQTSPEVLPVEVFPTCRWLQSFRSHILLPVQGVLSSQGGASGTILSSYVQMLWFVPSEMDLAALVALTVHLHSPPSCTDFLNKQNSHFSAFHWIILALVPAEPGLARRCHLSFSKGLLCCDQSLLALTFHNINFR